MFEVVKGGLLENAHSSSKKFLSAYVTDTRLMGVISIHAIWSLPENSNFTEYHQIFSLDAEEYGLDTYESITVNPDDEEALEEVKSSTIKIMGGLGANLIPLTERETKYLLQKYILFNIEKGIELPDIREVDFLLSPIIKLTAEEENILNYKQCTTLTNEYETINYFIMRCVGRDFEAAKLLTKNSMRTDLFPELPIGALLKNTIDEARDQISGTNSDYYATDEDNAFGTFETRKAYMCESLIEIDGIYYVAITQVTLDKLMVAKYERISLFKISLTEAMMMLKRDEYITLLDASYLEDPLEKESTPMLHHAGILEHESGMLFMIFKTNNDHVKERIFKLHNDVQGMYYLTDSNQLLLVAYSKEDIELLEKDIMNFDKAGKILPLGKFHFLESVINDFVESGIPDFEFFVSLISNNFEEEE